MQEKITMDTLNASYASLSNKVEQLNNAEKNMRVALGFSFLSVLGIVAVGTYWYIQYNVVSGKVLTTAQAAQTLLANAQ